jgi:hypothetical protein
LIEKKAFSAVCFIGTAATKQNRRAMKPFCRAHAELLKPGAGIPQSNNGARRANGLNQ